MINPRQLNNRIAQCLFACTINMKDVPRIIIMSMEARVKVILKPIVTILRTEIVLIKFYPTPPPLPPPLTKQQFYCKLYISLYKEALFLLLL